MATASNPSIARQPTSASVAHSKSEKLNCNFGIAIPSSFTLPQYPSHELCSTT